MLEVLDIQPAPLRTRVVDRLKTAMIVGELQAGEKLNERALCEALGVSRTSLREAMRVLESEGLIRSYPNRGAVVAEISATDVRDIYATRGALESLLIREFVARADNGQIAALEDTVDSLKRLNRSFELLKYVEIKTAFYEIIMDGSGNLVAAKALRSIHSRIAQLWATSLRHEGRAEQSAQEIEDIVKAVKARDAGQAEARLMDHNGSARDNTLKVLSKSGDPFMSS